MTRDALVEILTQHCWSEVYYGCACGHEVDMRAYDIMTSWAEHVADEIAAKDWCVVL